MYFRFGVQLCVVFAFALKTENKGGEDEDKVFYFDSDVYADADLPDGLFSFVLF